MLSQNGYPTQFLDKIISKFLDKIFKKRFTITTVPKKTLRLVLPYLGTQSLRLKKRLKKLFKEQLPSGKLECHLVLDLKTRFHVLYSQA